MIAHDLALLEAEPQCEVQRERDRLIAAMLEDVLTEWLAELRAQQVKRPLFKPHLHWEWGD